VILIGGTEPAEPPSMVTFMAPEESTQVAMHLTNPDADAGSLRRREGWLAFSPPQAYLRTELIG